MTTILKNLAKFNLLLLGAAMATLLLFYTMQRLISSEVQQAPPTSTLRIADITMPDLDITVITQQPRPEKIEDPVKPPELPEITSGNNIRGASLLAFEKPVFESGEDSGTNLATADANAIALIQVAPVYPQRALQREIEGYVVVEFDVDETGGVISPRVLYAEPEGYFESAALRALERYRYQPKVVNGRAVKMFGVQQKLSFTLEN
jgi:periplasmic protein TonB